MYKQLSSGIVVARLLLPEVDLQRFLQLINLPHGADIPPSELCLGDAALGKVYLVGYVPHWRQPR